MPYVFSCQNHRRAEGPEFSFEVKNDWFCKKPESMDISILTNKKSFIPKENMKCIKSLLK